MRAEVPFPDAPPYTAYVGNLSFDTAEPDLEDFFGALGVSNCPPISLLQRATADHVLLCPAQVTSIRMVMGQDGRPKGFGYVEFEAADGLRAALDRSGSDLQGRTIRVGVAEAPSAREGRADAVSSWERSGPLAPLAGRGGFSDRPRQEGYGGAAAGGEERDFGDMRAGNKFVPSAPAPDRGFGGGGNRSISGPGERRQFEPAPEVERDAPLRGGKFVASAPAPERRTGFGFGGERGERSAQEPSRADEQGWSRTGPLAAPAQRQSSFGFGRGGDSTPPSEPAQRQRLQLAARSAPSAEASPSSSPAPTSRASPFGAARAVDTATREREAEEKIAKQRAEAKADADARAAAKAAAAPAKQAAKERDWSAARGGKPAAADKKDEAKADLAAPVTAGLEELGLGEVTI